MRIERMTAFCGLLCNTCPIHLATLEQDESRQLAIRESIAEQCSKHYGLNLKPEDITDCDGCRINSGRIFSGCLNCEIRKCAIKKKIDSCAFCDHYVCEILENHFLHDQDAKIRIEEIRDRNNL